MHLEAGAVHQPEATPSAEKLTLEGCLLGGLAIVICDLLIGLFGMVVVFALLYWVSLLVYR